MSADSLARGYSIFVTYLAEPALRSLVIGCAAGIGLAAFRVKRVTARLLVWTAVLCTALAMPLLGVLLPRLPLAVPAAPLVQRLQARLYSAPVLVAQRERAASISKAAVQNDAIARRSETAIYTQGGKSLPNHSVRAATTSTFARSVSRPMPDAAKFESPSAHKATFPKSLEASTPTTKSLDAALIPQRSLAIPWTTLLLGMYLAGVMVLFARLLVGVCFSRRLERSARDIDEREALRLLRFRSCIAGLQNAPRLKESAALAVPATVGVRRSAILLPADWRSWTEEQLDAILAHEVSHVARRDGLTQMLSLVHRAIFWFSPLGWWVDKQLTDLAEQASDEAALAGGADRRRYAETLLGFFAQLQAARGRVWWQGVSMAKRTRAGSAERRVDRILAWRGAMAMKKSFAVTLIALAAPMIFLAASVHPFVAAAQDKPQGQAQNVVQPGGTKAPALPNAPKGGVASGVNGGVTGATPVAPALPPGPAAPGPGQGVVNPGPMPLAPTGGVAAGGPVAPAGLTGPMQERPSPSVQQSSIVIVGSVQDAEAELRRALTLYHSATSQFILDSVNLHVSKETLAAAKKAMDEAQAELAKAKAALAQANSVDLSAVQEELTRARQALEEANAVEARAVGGVASAAPLAPLASVAPLAPLASVAPLAPLAAVASEQDLQDQSDTTSHNITINGGSYTMGGGPRYVMIYGNGNQTDMSGTDEDLHHALNLRRKISGDFIWFERDEKSYVITDADFIAKVKALFAPEDALSKQQDELGRQQDELGAKQDALGEQMDNVKVKIRDITPDLERIRARLKELQDDGGATQTELGRLQSELGQLQSDVGRFQSQAGVSQSDIGRQQSELGRQQSQLGRRQGELGREQGEIARKASQQLRGMFDDAIAKGIAKPE
jgi:beta-lactamase regulating signal transducer with metallopeptidase domain/peptidoglycan hydrolase CwlO-like protein